jgi:hypothetical protein
MSSDPDSADPDFVSQTRPASRQRTRDPVTGHLRPRPCHLFFPGHESHWVQAIRSAQQPHRRGALTHFADNVVTVDFGDAVERYRTCDIERLLEIVGLGHPVDVCEQYSLLKTSDGYCFSVAKAEEPWVECAYSMTPASPAVSNLDEEEQIGMIASELRSWFGAELRDRSADIDNCARNISEGLHYRREMLIRYGKEAW